MALVYALTPSPSAAASLEEIKKRGYMVVATEDNYPPFEFIQNGQPVGRLSVVRFDTLAALEKGGDGLYRNASNAAPVDANDVQLRQGMLEGSNVNPILEITNLIEISRSYERISKMIENNNDLSRRSVERLGRVS